MNEIKSKRTLNEKHFSIGNSKKLYKGFAYSGHKHYNNKLKRGDGVTGLREIDWTLIWDNSKKGWGFEFHNFNPFFPEYADDWAEFRDLFEDKDQTIKYKPVCGHVKGRLVQSIEGVTEMNAVIYDDAFGQGMDLIYYLTRTQMLKVVRIRDGFKPATDISFDFEIEFPNGKSIRRALGDDEYELDTSKDKRFDSVRVTKIGDADGDTFLKGFKIWDSNVVTADNPFGKKVETITVDMVHEQGRLILRKNVPVAFFDDSVGDVFTDTTTSYYDAGGDGRVWNTQTSVSWSTLRDASSGSDVENGATTMHCQWWDGGATEALVRAFNAINLSGFSASDTIHLARFHVYAQWYVPGVSGSHDIYLDVASQASTSTLATSDYSNVSTTTLAPAEDANNWGNGTEAWHYFTLSDPDNDLNKGSYQKMVMRFEGDHVNTKPTEANKGIINIGTSEGASETYLEIIYGEVISTTDIQAWWDFDEGSGGTVADSGSGGYDVTLNNSPSWVTSGPTNLPDGVDFNGSTQDGDTSFDCDLTEGAVFVWVNHDADSGDEAPIDWGNFNGEVSLWIDNAGTLHSRSKYTSDRDISGGAFGSGSNKFIVYNFKSGAMELFVNGVSVGTNTNTGTLTDTNHTVQIANSSGYGTHWFDGKIFQAAIIDRILTDDEIEVLYNSGAGVTYATATNAASSSIKSIAGVAQASVKSVAGVANASIKSIGGVANS